MGSRAADSSTICEFVNFHCLIRLKGFRLEQKQLGTIQRPVIILSSNRVTAQREFYDSGER